MLNPLYGLFATGCATLPRRAALSDSTVPYDVCVTSSTLPRRTPASSSSVAGRVPPSGSSSSLSEVPVVAIRRGVVRRPSSRNSRSSIYESVYGEIQITDPQEMHEDEMAMAVVCDGFDVSAGRVDGNVFESPAKTFNGMRVGVWSAVAVREAIDTNICTVLLLHLLCLLDNCTVFGSDSSQTTTDASFDTSVTLTLLARLFLLVDLPAALNHSPQNKSPYCITFVGCFCVSP